MDWKKTTIESSPHLHHPLTTTKIMWTVSLTLAPAALWGVHIFGIKALFVLLASIASAVLTEAAVNLSVKLFSKKENWTFKDGSAFLTGLLVGMNMPPEIPVYIPIIASIFAILVVKWAFGGLGTNWMNPALAGRVFVFFSWTDRMTSWTLPLEKGQRLFSRLFIQNDILTSASDTYTGATPLTVLKTVYVSVGNTINGPLEALMGAGTPTSYWDLFLGRIPGCIGEISALLLLLGALYLFIRKIITWKIPVAYLGSFLLMVWIFGGIKLNQGFFSGDILFHLLAGGLILGVFYMATDMVTSPLTAKGQILFGIGCGLMTFIIRFYGNFPEGVSLAILFMNIFVPLIDKFTKTNRYGVIKGKKANE